VLEVLRQQDVVYREGAWTPGGRGVQLGSFQFPTPIGRQPVIRFPSSEVITLPRHTRTENLPVVQAAVGPVPHPALARVAQVGLPVAQAVLRTPVYRLARRSAGKSAAGPSESERAGVLAPSQAFDPEGFLTALEPVGLAWSVQPN
jgi:hypothetical protein